jgi:[protein-PII] uridylyltransferase
MADLAGGLALAGLQIRSARVLTQRGVASSLWETTRAEVDPAGLQMRLRKVLDGSLDLASRLSVPSGGDRVPPIVTVLPVLSPTATVIEVRARDRRGLVWSVCRSISAAGWEIRSAHLSTFGPEARDVFYVVDGADGASPDERAECLCQQVAAALA